MAAAFTLIIIDARSNVRAQLAMSASQCGYHVEIFESADEVAAARWPDSGLILAGEGVCLDSLLGIMSHRQRILPVIAMAPDPSTADVVAAMQAGASDFLVLPATATTLCDMVDRYEWFARQAANSVPAIVARQRIANLSQREREVLRGIAEGLASKMIAHHLDISPRTVEQHRANLMKKLGADRLADALKLYWSARSSLPLTAPEAEPSALSSPGAAV